jgi:hypothetical protein
MCSEAGVVGRVIFSVRPLSNRIRIASQSKRTRGLSTKARRASLRSNSKAEDGEALVVVDTTRLICVFTEPIR